MNRSTWARLRVGMCLVALLATPLPAAEDVRPLLGRMDAIRPVQRAAAIDVRTTRISVASDGTQADGDSNDPSISADGRYVVFQSSATNLAPGSSRDGG